MGGVRCGFASHEPALAHCLANVQVQHCVCSVQPVTPALVRKVLEAAAVVHLVGRESEAAAPTRLLRTIAAQSPNLLQSSMYCTRITTRSQQNVGFRCTGARACDKSHASTLPEPPHTPARPIARHESRSAKSPCARSITHSHGNARTHMHGGRSI